MILPLENQVCSLESAKRLKELGVQQDSMFQYCFHASTGNSDYVHLVFDGQGLTSCGMQYLKIAAYTVAELGELLPEFTISNKAMHKFKWECSHMTKDLYRSLSGADTEAEARAKMLIHLIESGRGE